uniref:Terpene synthase metal-binding domain-containing protein n=1 Tax=Aegilops tauschii subsp. strangulata TaxID=200361 RepID=A0A453DR09_AEGTS
MQYQLQSEYYMQEAQWTNDKYEPSFEEHVELSGMSTGLPMLNLMALMGYDGTIATQEVFEWMSVPVPDAVRAGALIGRFLNDISSYKVYFPPKRVEHPRPLHTATKLHSSLLKKEISFMRLTASVCRPIYTRSCRGRG